MIILDTSVWIEFLRARPGYFDEVKILLERGVVIALEWIFGELMQGAKDQRERDVIMSYWQNLPKINAAGLWLVAGVISSEERIHARGVGLIDCAIIAAARKTGACIWTLDKKLGAVLTAKEKYIPAGIILYHRQRALPGEACD